MTDSRGISILVVEDEADIATLLQYNLEAAGYRTTLAVDGKDALPFAIEHSPDLIVLDYMLPNRNGLEICQDLRKNLKTKHIPIIMLTARGTEQDKISGLNAGADDYITKPFSPKELLARIQAVLRRTPNQTQTHDVIECGDIRIDLKAHRAYRQNQKLTLRPAEFKLLCHFMQNPGQVFTRQQLLAATSHTKTYVEERTIDVHIRYLRVSLAVGSARDPIQTVRSTGYRFELDDFS